MTDTIDVRIRAWLEQRKPPVGLNEGQREALITDIITVVKKHAPEQNSDAWVGEVIERAMVRHKGLSWPPPAIWAVAVGGAIHAASADDMPSGQISDKERSFLAFCEKINAGGVVAEPMIFGQFADRALAEGRFSLGRLREYQRATFRRRAQVHGRPAAMRWLEDICPALHAEMEDANEKAERELRPQHVSDAELPMMGDEI